MSGSFLFSLEHSTSQIHDNGYYIVPSNDDWGVKMERIVAEGYRIQNPHTLKVCMDSTYQNEIVRSLLTTMVQQPALSSWQFLSYRLGLTYCFAGNKKSGSLRSPGLLIQIWSRGGEGVFYRRSHNQILGLVPTNPDIGWLMIPEDNLSDEGAQVIPFPQGGLVVTDLRLGFKITKGTVMTIGFCPQDLRDSFHLARPMLQAKDPDIKEMVEGMNRDAKHRGITLDIGFRDGT